VRTASLSPLKISSPGADSLFDDVLHGRATPTELAQFDRASVTRQNELLARSDREARAGAGIVFWSEEAAFLRKEAEAALVSHAASLATANHIYLGLSLGVIRSGEALPVENELILLDPHGKTVFQYIKSRPTPGPEIALAARSSGKLPLAETPYGKLSAAICYDADFPSLLAQAGRMRADIVLSPASDWAGIDPRHTQMAQFRAIEQGFNLVRQANMGLSAASDYEGHTLAAMDEYHSSDLTLVAEVPTGGVWTVYSRLGDWFAWLCIGCLIALVAMAWHSFRSASQYTC
jgi:apolipoprotein N-acyltransferase